MRRCDPLSKHEAYQDTLNVTLVRNGCDAQPPGHYRTGIIGSRFVRKRFNEIGSLPEATKQEDRLEDAWHVAILHGALI